MSDGVDPKAARTDDATASECVGSDESLAAGTAAAGGTDAEHALPAQVQVGVHWAFLVGAIVSVGAVVVAFFVHTPKGPELTDAQLERVE